MLITVENLSHTFDEKKLYDKVSFRLLENEKIGLVGANGTGKTTLINILCGNVIPDEGKIWVNPNVKIGYLDQYAKMDSEQTIYQYLSQAYASLLKENEELEELHKKISHTTDANDLDRLVMRASRLRDKLESHNIYQIDSEINKVASGLGLVALGLGTMTSKLSGGQKVKVMLGKVLLEDPDVLILDEPTNFLDTNHVEWLMKFLKEFKGAFLIVSHNEEFLNNVVNRILDLEFTHINKYKGNYQEYLVKKAMRIEDYEREYTKEQKQIAKLEDYIARNKVRASTARLAKSREKQLAKINPLEKPPKMPKTHFSFTYKPISASKLLEVKDLEIGYYYSLLPKMSFVLKNRDKISLQGFNGIGKSTLMKTLIGQLKPIKGSFSFYEDVVIGYFAQDHIWQNPKLTPLEEIQNEYPQLSNREVRTRLASVGLIDKIALQPLETLSGGEQAKVKLCKILFKPCNVLLLDEPTNHLDHDAKETLVKAIKDFPGSVIFVTHENEFASEITDKVFNIEDLLSD